MDRVYLSSPNIIAVLDHERKRTYVIRKEGLPDVGKLFSWQKLFRNHMTEGGVGNYVCLVPPMIPKTLIFFNLTSNMNKVLNCYRKAMQTLFICGLVLW